MVGIQMRISKRVYNISEQTLYRRKNKYGNMELADFKRLKELEKENSEAKNDVGRIDAGKSLAQRDPIYKVVRPA